jgi:phage tail-like protein
MKQVKTGRTYMQFLPSVFHEEVKDEKRPFIERYLKIFERILSGIEDGELKGKKGIAEMLDIISDIFHPRFSFLFDETEKRFLPPLKKNEKNIFKNYFRADVDVDDFLNEFLRWLASWMALVLKEDWELEKKREVIARIIPIYRMRGTKRGLEEYLNIYVGKHISIIDEVEPFRVGVTSCIGKKARIGGLPPYFFIVEVDVMYMFSWDKVPGNDSDRLLNYLRDDFGIGWAEGAEIYKSEDNKTIHIRKGKKSAEILMDRKKKKATLTIRGGKTHELKVKKENKKFTIYNVKNIKASDIKKWKTKKKAIEEIINSEKPAHTDYWLDIKHPRMTLGVNSTVGENTLL